MTDTPKYAPGTVYGNPVTPKLTKEQRDEVAQLIVEGLTQKAITEKVGCSIGRVREVQASLSAAEAAAVFQATKVTPKALTSIQATLGGLVGLVESLVAEVNAVKGELRKANKALFRRQLELKKARETLREQKEALKELKRFYHQKTGREFL